MDGDSLISDVMHILFAPLSPRISSMADVFGVKKHREEMNEKAPRAISLTTFKCPLISYITQSRLLCLGLAKPL